ncbi:hypothetical protein [Caenimonas soli]|uniref:hypothetical protein n=1 Tax=Caenimonas soli TaxID=2735555 RepID=UPI0015566774|nr:hypothetical protein [Caenimonas soli]NPC56335.1 hypothetical protein [Caenimonas soli]
MVVPLEDRSGDGANNARLADAAVSQWQAIDAALAPIIGNLGVAALYHRSLFLSLKAHPWLDHQRSPDVLDLPALRAALLAARDPAEVPEASATLLRTFMELLASLVGAPLAERLLGPLWAPSPAGTSGQDTTTS